MTVDQRDEGGDPACWLHLFDDDPDEALAGATPPADDASTGPPAAEPHRSEVEAEAAAERPRRSDDA